jgi:predicted O-methyltransferase YrrM
VALPALASLPGAFLPWTSFSMRPSAILAIVSDIAINRRRSVVECGSGNSTVYAARVLAQHGVDGHVSSLDHDPRWAEQTARALERDGLERWATITYAPLVDGWYDRAWVPAVEAIDLLVVDGPPAWTPGTERAREPALDVFGERLGPGATIILDDAWRPGERAVIGAWERRHGLTFHVEPGRYAVATQGG